MSKSIIAEKAYTFSIRVVKMYQHLSADKKEFILSKQVIRSGTSIGANVEEAIGGQSTADFVHKLSIARKEARETSYGSDFYTIQDILKKRILKVYITIVKSL